MSKPTEHPDHSSMEEAVHTGEQVLVGAKEAGHVLGESGVAASSSVAAAAKSGFVRTGAYGASAALAGYAVLNSDNPLQETAHQGALFVAAEEGAAAAAAAALGPCAIFGPGEPACVLVAGASGAYLGTQGMDAAWGALDEASGRMSLSQSRARERVRKIMEQAKQPYPRARERMRKIMEQARQPHPKVNLQACVAAASRHVGALSRAPARPSAANPARSTAVLPAARAPEEASPNLPALSTHLSEISEGLQFAYQTAWSLHAIGVKLPQPVQFSMKAAASFKALSASVAMAAAGNPVTAIVMALPALGQLFGLGGNDDSLRQLSHQMAKGFEHVSQKIDFSTDRLSLEMKAHVEKSLAVLKEMQEVQSVSARDADAQRQMHFQSLSHQLSGLTRKLVRLQTQADQAQVYQTGRFNEIEARLDQVLKGVGQIIQQPVASSLNELAIAAEQYNRAPTEGAARLESAFKAVQPIVLGMSQGQYQLTETSLPVSSWEHALVDFARRVQSGGATNQSAAALRHADDLYRLSLYSVSQTGVASEEKLAPLAAWLQSLKMVFVGQQVVAQMQQGEVPVFLRQQIDYTLEKIQGLLGPVSQEGVPSLLTQIESWYQSRNNRVWITSCLSDLMVQAQAAFRQLEQDFLREQIHIAEESARQRIDNVVTQINRFEPSSAILSSVPQSLSFDLDTPAWRFAFGWDRLYSYTSCGSMGACSTSILPNGMGHDRFEEVEATVKVNHDTCGSRNRNIEMRGFYSLVPWMNWLPLPAASHQTHITITMQFSQPPLILETLPKAFNFSLQRPPLTNLSRFQTVNQARINDPQKKVFFNGTHFESVDFLTPLGQSVGEVPYAALTDAEITAIAYARDPLASREIHQRDEESVKQFRLLSREGRQYLRQRKYEREAALKSRALAAKKHPLWSTLHENPHTLITLFEKTDDELKALLPEEPRAIYPTTTSADHPTITLEGDAIPLPPRARLNELLGLGEIHLSYTTQKAPVTENQTRFIFDIRADWQAVNEEPVLMQSWQISGNVAREYISNEAAYALWYGNLSATGDQFNMTTPLIHHRNPSSAFSVSPPLMQASAWQVTQALSEEVEAMLENQTEAAFETAVQALGNLYQKTIEQFEQSERGAVRSSLYQSLMGLVGLSHYLKMTDALLLGLKNDHPAIQFYADLSQTPNLPSSTQEWATLLWQPFRDDDVKKWGPLFLPPAVFDLPAAPPVISDIEAIRNEIEVTRQALIKPALPAATSSASSRLTLPFYLSVLIKGPYFAMQYARSQLFDPVQRWAAPEETTSSKPSAGEAFEGDIFYDASASFPHEEIETSVHATGFTVRYRVWPVASSGISCAQEDCAELQPRCEIFVEMNSELQQLSAGKNCAEPDVTRALQQAYAAVPEYVSAQRQARLRQIAASGAYSFAAGFANVFLPEDVRQSLTSGSILAPLADASVAYACAYFKVSAGKTLFARKAVTSMVACAEAAYYAQVSERVWAGVSAGVASGSALLGTCAGQYASDLAQRAQSSLAKRLLGLGFFAGKPPRAPVERAVVSRNPASFGRHITSG